MPEVFTSSIKQSKHLAIAVMGDGGSGKTSLVRWLVDAGLKCAVLDSDKGLKAIEDLARHKNFLQADCSTNEKFIVGWNALDKLDADWIGVIDTFTDYLDEKAETCAGDAEKDYMNVYKVVGKAGTTILRAIKNRSKGRDMILLCQEERIQNPEGRMFWGPNLFGKMTGKIFTAKFDGVLRCYVKSAIGQDKPEYKMLTVTTEDSATKLRVPPAIREQIPYVIDSNQFGVIYRDLLRQKSNP